MRIFCSHVFVCWFVCLFGSTFLVCALFFPFLFGCSCCLFAFWLVHWFGGFLVCLSAQIFVGLLVWAVFLVFVLLLECRCHIACVFTICLLALAWHFFVCWRCACMFLSLCLHVCAPVSLCAVLVYSCCVSLLCLIVCYFSVCCFVCFLFATKDSERMDSSGDDTVAAGQHLELRANGVS